MNGKRKQPCEKILDKECFEQRPKWARQAFAYRLLHLLFPPEITRLLPRVLRLPLFPPGIEIPPEQILPDGSVAGPITLPEGEIPAGVIIPPGTVVYPWSLFPPGWTPYMDWPPGIMPPPRWWPYFWIDGTIPPGYAQIWEPGPAHRPVSGGAKITVQASFVGTNDGMLIFQDSSWDEAHDATDANIPVGTLTESGTAVEAARFVFSWDIHRSFFSFDLSGIPAGARVIAATLTLHSYDTEQCNVSVQEGTQGSPLSNADFDAFTGEYFAVNAWELNSNTFEFNDIGIAYIQSVIGATANICMREYDHDYLDVSPADGEAPAAGVCYSGTANPEDRPKLTVTYEI